MERLLTVEFGPSRSKRFGKAVALAQSGPGECTEVEPGRYRARFLLGEDSSLYRALGRLLERVRHWRATEVSEGGEPVSSYHAKEMAWCASFQLGAFGECREHFQFGVLPRCALCPLFDAERAIRAGIREEPLPRGYVQAAFSGDDTALLSEPDVTLLMSLDVLFDSGLMDELEGELPEWIDLSPVIPDFPPEEWPDTPVGDGPTI
jgi:hypothetical protein